METPVGEVTLRGAARTAGTLLAGAVGTAVGAVALLLALRPVRPLLYDAYYRRLGPWGAEVAATVLPFAAAAIAAGTVVTALAVAVAGDRERATRVGAGLGGGVGLVVALLAGASYLGAGGLLAAVVAVGAFAVAAPVALGRLGGWTGGGPAFLGSVPATVLLVLVLGFGLGWGGGYDLVAREVPAGEVSEPAATFADYPALRDDLLQPDEGTGDAGYCESDDGRRVCRLPLRGYDRAPLAGRFLADHGARCRFRGTTAPAPAQRSFVAVDGNTSYRITCVTYGD